MARTISLEEAQERLEELTREFQEAPEAAAIAITEDGERVLAMVGWDRCQKMLATVDNAKREGILGLLHEALRDHVEGRIP